MLAISRSWLKTPTTVNFAGTNIVCCLERLDWQTDSKYTRWTQQLAENQQKTHTHTRLTAFCPGLPGWAGTRKVKPTWTLLKQETVSGSGISWAIRKSASRSRQKTTPAPHHSVFYRPDALPVAQPTASKHWRQKINRTQQRHKESVKESGVKCREHR